MIDENYCLSVDHLGRPVDIYHDPDYILKCVGFWKENLKSYLITYDELDPLSVNTLGSVSPSRAADNKTTFPFHRNTDVGCINGPI